MKERKPNRLQGYDYSQGGYYFVTVCAHNRKEILGRIENGETILNEYGAIAAIHWADIPKYYRNVELDEWVVMPNHIHGIVVININVGTEHCSVPTLSQIIKSFKGITIKRIRSELGDIRFSWQRSFYDHVIRNEYALQRIREYIVNNPLSWELDIENPGNLGGDTRAYYNKIIKSH